MKFLPNDTKDYENPNKNGDRTDKKDLIEEWIRKMKKDNKKHKFIWNATEFRETKMREYDHVLG